jgi:site-specific recombinase XerD
MREKLLDHLKDHKHELLFVNRNGRPYSRDKVVSKVLHPVLDELGIKHKGRRCGLHAFRHGLGTLLASIKASVASTQRQLRHKDPRSTFGHYVHVVPSDLIQDIECIQSVLIRRFPKLLSVCKRCSFGRGGGDRKQQHGEFQGLTRNEREC